MSISLLALRLVVAVFASLFGAFPSLVGSRGVPRAGFWNGASTLKQYFVLPKNGSKYYLKDTFLAFPVPGSLGLGTPLVGSIILLAYP